MWEYSIKLLKENKKISDKIFSILKRKTGKFKSVVVSYFDENYCSVTIAVEEKYVENIEELLAKIITKIICYDFKGEFLEKFLFMPEQDSINITAFKNALINFDKETDYFLVSKNLILEKEIFLESFYNFRLSKLQEKWGELVNLANENKDYLVCKDAFYDLLKFLIDNIDVTKREIEVFEDENGYRIIPSVDMENEEYENKLFSSEALVSSLIELSPRKIELYYSTENDATSLLKTIFEKRVNLHNDKLETDNLQILNKR